MASVPESPTARYPVGTCVAVWTDEAQLPHLAIVKAVGPRPDTLPDGEDAETEEELEDWRQMTVLWMYRTCDCEELPTLELVRAPCRAERLGKDGSGRQKVPDSGELKEVFFSSHDTTITNNTVQHEVKVLFLKSCKTRVDAEAYQAMPGFLCRYIVDTTAWKYYALDPRLMESAEDAELLQLLLAKTAAELPARAAAS